jgi:hypothetical protein
MCSNSAISDSQRIEPITKRLTMNDTMLTCFIGGKLAEVRFVFVYFLRARICWRSLEMSLICILRDVWIRTQSAAVASRRATNLATLNFVVSVQRHEYSPQTRQ